MEVEMTWIEIIYSKKQREQRLKKKKKEQILRILWDNWEGLTLVPSVFQKVMRKSGAEKMVWRKHDWKLPCFDKRQTNSASSESLKQDKLEEIRAQIHHDQTTKNQRRGKKPWRQPEKSDAFQGNSDLNESRDATRPGRQWNIFSVLKPEFYIWQNTLREWRWDRDIISYRKTLADLL